jgi:hypothetical protein
MCPQHQLIDLLIRYTKIDKETISHLRNKRTMLLYSSA